MTFGAVILAHQDGGRVAALTRWLRRGGVPVCVHLDRRSPGAWKNKVRDQLPEDVRVLSRHRSAWGTWGLVAASLDGAADLLDQHPAIGHIALLSESCMPLRPVCAIATALSGRPGVDFIESVPLGDTDWVKGGLSEERFGYWFPVGWKQHRRLFDGLVAAQRRLGVRRRLPAGLEPHLGQQWWCLSRATLTAILTHPERARWESFYRRTWIPDEAFFQTLVRRVGRGRVAAPVTHQVFDPCGRPRVFYDEDFASLRASGALFARKVDPDAAGLLAWAFDDAPPPTTLSFVPGPLPAFATPASLQAGGQPDLGVVVICAAAEQVDNVLGEAAAILPETVVHGRLMATDRIRFAGDAAVWRGCFTDAPRIRDHAPAQFLARLRHADLPHPMIWGATEAEFTRLWRLSGGAVPDHVIRLGPSDGIDALLTALGTSYGVSPGSRARQPDAA